MSRSAHQRQQQKLQQQQQQLLAQQMADNEAAAAAAEMFDYFCVATTMRQILGLHRQMCDVIGLRPAPLNEFYPKLKAKVRSWKAQALWKKFDARAAHRAYAKGNACTGTRVLVIGAGPCGLRTAIEAQLLGAKVVVVEKRDRISRNNVLHLWPFVITDLRNLGAKKFYGKFCAGSIDHISIRQLQCILLKVALLLGVEVHEGVSFERTIEPSGDGCGWRAQVSPSDHAVSHYEFDVLIGADGKRNTLEGFKRKEFRGKLAIAITANFINKKTEAEAKAEEISGVAFIFNQSFFKELYHTTGIDLENIVYYKDETHYFVMTAKKHSLIDKGVIIQDFADPAELLAPVNVNTEKLLDYAREAAEFSTKYQMPNLEFAVNHYGKPDVAMFDFTSMFAAETSCRVIVRHGFRLLQCLVGDSLLEPFWPTGSGCARGFLSSMDAAYAIKLWSNPANSTLGVLAQRESIYRLLGQTTPENLQRDTGSYTVDPATRYPNLNRTSVNVWQVKHLIDTDDKSILEQTFMDTNALQVTQVDTPVRRKRRSGDSMPLSTVLLRWICAQLHAYEFTKDLKEVSDVFTNGKVLCALINRYRPDLVDFNAIKDLSPIEMNDLAFKILDKELHIPRIMTGKDSIQLNNVESKVWLSYLEQICEVFRGEIPHVKHPKIDFSDLREKYRINYTNVQPDFSKLLQMSSNKQKSKSPIQGDAVDVPQGGGAAAASSSTVQRRSVLDEEKLKRQRRHELLLASGNNAAAAAAAGGAGNIAQTDTPRRAKKRRSAEKAANIEERQKRLQEIEQNRQDRMSKRRQQRYQQTQNFYKSLHMLQANILLREADENTPFEDYSIFMYRQQAPEFNDRVKELERKLLYPDRERSDIPSAVPRSNADEQFSDRIKSMEQRITSSFRGNDKKPKDLMRAIGKIDSNDWNVREIEKKIEQSKKTEVHGPKGREKVPKWSREQFQARQHKMAKPTRQDSAEEKFKEIDQTLKILDKQLKEGNVLEPGKVASIAGQFVKRDVSEEKNAPPPSNTATKSSTKVALAFKKQAASEKCHFCRQTVYLMEKLQTENLIMHRGCLKCHHCHTNLRLGAYAFDRDDPNGRFYCTQHFRLPAKPTRPVVRKPGQRKSSGHPNEQAAAAAAASAVSAENRLKVEQDLALNSESGEEPKTPEKRGPVDNVSKMELLERGQTPERIEFENTDAMSDGEPSEEHIIDEHEWSGRNFLPESNNDSESDLTSSDESDTDSESDMFEEANDSPLGAQTLQLASEWIGKQNYTDSDDSDDFYDSSEGLADDGKDDTEGEEFAKARELRREEVRLPPLPPNLPTDTETENKSLNETNENETTIKDKENNEINTQKSEEKDTTSLGVEGENSKDNNSNVTNKSQNNEGNLLEVVPDLIKRKDSAGSDPESFKSTTSSIIMPLNNGLDSSPVKTTKADIEKLEQNSDSKLSKEIDAISAKLYNLSNVVKMNKDLDTIAKENMIQSDILKKLSMKEKWLAENKASEKNPAEGKNKFEEKLNKFKDDLAAKAKFLEQQTTASSATANQTNPYAPKSQFKDVLKKPGDNKTELENKLPEKGPQKPAMDSREVLAQIKELINKENEQLKANNKKPLSRTNSLKGSNSANKSPQLPKSTKSSADVNTKMEIENILGIVKNIEISKTTPQKAKEPHQDETSKDMGKMLYKIETKFSPKPNRRLTEKLKEIETKNFSGTLDSIKSQMETPTISTQHVPANVDLSKYFPNQQQRKDSTSNVNKNQKSLQEVDLSKYFPTSPAPQRRSSVVTVADRLKKSQTEKALDSKANKPSAPKRQASMTSGTSGKDFSLKDNQMDGAVDIEKMKAKVVATANVSTKPKVGGVAASTTMTTTAPATKTITTTTATAVATPGKKGKNVKIIKKIVRKGSLKKTPAAKKSLIPRDEDDLILDEILHSDEMRSPSLEYQQLFQEERSPSDDLSDKIEHILEETGIDLGLKKKSSSSPSTNRKKLLKAKSFGEGELPLQRKNSMLGNKDVRQSPNKEEGDLPSGVQNILKRFESMSSVPNSSEPNFKLRRMESTTSNLNKSKESIVSRESDSFSDLEKTMEYLKSEWRNEATNFLQKKRSDFQKTHTIHKNPTKAEVEVATTNGPDHNVFSNSKYAKFFGFKQKSPERAKVQLKTPQRKVDKSPEKRKSPLKKKLHKSPEKKIKKPSPSPPKEMVKKTAPQKPIVYASLEELALIRVSEDLSKTKEMAQEVNKDTKANAGDNLRGTLGNKENMEEVDSKASKENIQSLNSPLNKDEEKDTFSPKEQEKSKSQSITPPEPATKATSDSMMSSHQNNENQTPTLVDAGTPGNRPYKQSISIELKPPASNNGENESAPTTKPGLKSNSINFELKTAGDSQTSPTTTNSFNEEATQNENPNNSMHSKPHLASVALSKNETQNIDLKPTAEAIVSSSSSSPTEVAVTPPKRPLVEDIRNLPKTGCDKSLSGSRRSSLASLQSRRQSNVSMGGEITIDNLDSLLDPSDLLEDKSILLNEHYDEDSLCTSISKSPSVAPITVQMRGSSEDDSIDNLFSQFSDEMLVNVEFDSNDELIEIIPVNEEIPLDTVKTPPRLDVPLQLPRSDNNFPCRPKRRQKSKSSSSDSTPPLAPQRLKKKLSKLSPTNMPPSVQEVMQVVCKSREMEPEKPLEANKPLRFPRLIDEDEVLIEDSPIASKLFTHDIYNKDPSITKISGSRGSLAVEEENTPSTHQVPSIQISANIVNDGFGYGPNRQPENVTEFTKVLKPIEKEVPEETVEDQIDTVNKELPNDEKNNDLKAKAPSLEWNMEMLPNSPMPKHKTLPKHLQKPDSMESLTETEKTSDWNMEMLPRSPMPQRKFKEELKENPPREKEEKTPRRDSNSLLKEKSPTSSIKLLNTIDLSTEGSEKRLIEEFELERRQALIQRDKDYNVNEKPIEMKPPRKGSGSSSGSGNSPKTATPINSSSFMPKQSPRGSRRSSVQSSTGNRGGTPPMTKPLEIPSPAQTEQSSRRSSFAFIELLDNKPVIAPMPKKLDLPKLEDEKLQPDNLKGEVADDIKNRPWPKPQNEEPEEEEGQNEEDDVASKPVEYANLMEANANGPKRQWPDGRTIFEKNKNHKGPLKPRSETPELSRNANELDWEAMGKPASKSITDLSKVSLPYGSNYSLATASTAPAATRAPLSMSSNESEYDMPRYNKSSTPQRPARHQRPTATGSTALASSGSMDASTQLLLERSKRLHDRKRDFVNERVVERNPYMKEVIAAERRNSLGGGGGVGGGDTYYNSKYYDSADDDDDDGDLPTRYRSRPYTTSGTTRFPSSRTLGRSYNTSSYDYVPSYADTSSSLYGSSRRLPTVAPISSSYSSYKSPYSGVGYGGRSSYLNDFSSRHSPSSHYRERGGTAGTGIGGDDSCVICLKPINQSQALSFDELPSSTPPLSSPLLLLLLLLSLPNRSRFKREERAGEIVLNVLILKLHWVRSLKVQSDTETSTSDELEHNSATEISTDSEFDNDELIRSAPKIFIDDTHLRKPTKVQVKSTVIPPNTIQKYNSGSNIPQYRGGMVSATGIGTSGPYLAKYQTPQQQLQQQQQQQQNTPQIPQFKPLVQVDPSLLTSNRTPLQNPRPGDYLLNKTASTEGIASKKSLELKKRYLLGEPANGNKIQKSGSTSVLDSRIRSFQSNISECQKLLNPSNEISPSMKTFLDRTKLGEKTNTNELMRSATNNILNDLKVEITIQKASSTASTDNEKENVYVNNKNELNKCMEYSETVNAALLDTMAGKRSSANTTPTNNKSILETIDLTTPEKEVERDKSDSNKVIDLTGDSPEQKSNRTIVEEGEIKPPDVSKDVKQVIPDILGHIGESQLSPMAENMGDKTPTQQDEHSMEKEDAPEKEHMQEDNEVEDVQIEVPNIEWNTHKEGNLSCSSSNSSCSSHSSSLEDIEHFILESTTSPETHNSAIAMVSSSSGGNHQVPRLEVHDTSGTLMQIDSLMIIDGKYIGDPEDLKYMELPKGVTLPEEAAVKTIELEHLDDEKDHETEHEPVTATPEPVETTVIEVGAKTSTDEVQEIESEADAIPPPLPETGPPLPEKGPPKVKPSMLKFDTKNENKIESLKNLPLILDSGTVEHTKAVKPKSLNLTSAHKSMESPVTSPLIDMDKTPTGDLLSRGSDSETEPTGTAQILTETELSDWTADDCISENFVELDYANRSSRSSKGSKGHKKSKRKGSVESMGGRLPSTNEVMQELAKAVAPVAEFEGILKSIDLDDIEFMDTGSEDESSGTEPHSATNTALLRNRGYMEFVDQEKTPKHVATKTAATALDLCKPIAVKRDERLGVDYIEQGAYIMHPEDANKTPVNETSKHVMSSSGVMSQSLTDSSTINDLEDDSVNSQIHISSTTSASSRQGGNKSANTAATTSFTTTTTEESEALTVVSSPLDSSPHTRNSASGHKRDYLVDGSGSTPSSTDRAPKSSQSTSCTNSATTSSKNTPPRQSSKDSPPLAPGDRRSNDELSYEEYVRALQQKIVQISTTARGDSLEAKKQRRKSSKGEASLNQQTSVIDNTTMTAVMPPTNLSLDPSEESHKTIGQDGAPEPTQLHSTATAAQKKVPEIPTLTSKLEEITKERTKQKDLIHDLVMDKLQSKKQLNAEKRLHRSRQRSIMTSGLGGTAGGSGTGCGYSSGSSLSPTPKLAAANSTTDTNCTNQAHYHVSTASLNPTSPSARTAAATQRFLSNSSSFKENHPTTTSYVSPYGGMEALSPIRANAYKMQRPFSEHLEGEQFKDFEQRYKLNKTPSFAYGSAQKAAVATQQPVGSSTPIPPLRQNRGKHGNGQHNVDGNVETPANKDSNFSTSTENLRSEARARARLKSNSELGLSPEEKMQLLRKRIQNEYSSSNSNNGAKQVSATPSGGYERQTSLRDSKMNTSKSVNDLAYQMGVSAGGSGKPDSVKVLANAKTDFTSDPNILLSSMQQQQQQHQQLHEKPIAGTKKLNRRAKDPERRKSLIQSLSNFFHMGQNNKENKSTTTTSDVNSAQPEQTGTGASGSSHGTPTSSSSGIDNVLSRFRISPKSKEKSRSCIELREIYIGDKDKDDYSSYTTDSPTRRLRTSSMSMAALSCYECPRQQQQSSQQHHHHHHHHHSSSQDALTRSHCTPPTHHYSHNQLNNLNFGGGSPKHKSPTNSGSNNCLQRIYSSNNGQHQNIHHQQQQHHQQRKDARSSHHTTSPSAKKSSSSSALAFSSSSPQLCVHKSQSMTNASHNAAAAVGSPSSPVTYDDQIPPPIPPLPLNYQRSDDESYTNETRDQKKQRAISKAVRQAELKRLRIAQEIQREQEEIEVQLKELETRGVLIEKALRGEEQTLENLESGNNIGSNDEKLLKELLEIWRNITQLKKRDEELGIRQQELQLEHRHAQLKEELNMRLSCNKLDKSSADVAAEGAILNEMLEIVAKRAALRPSSSQHDLAATTDLLRGTTSTGSGGGGVVAADLASGSSSSKIQLSTSSRGQSNDTEESNI
ncbi:F-actin-monooxygenase Mical [Musca domestica]|uniref:F-actin monooxygenase n=1 Tax=Musca domestica TaxID=7370 RepID=A0ABM3V306_MUSDO|nr:F-actin-monooxygenase Mical [Musca domestica]